MNYVLLVTEINSFEKLVDKLSDMISWYSIIMFFNNFKEVLFHVLKYKK